MLGSSAHVTHALGCWHAFYSPLDLFAKVPKVTIVHNALHCIYVRQTPIQ